jgi:cholesterol transport system auxiliary component
MRRHMMFIVALITVAGLLAACTPTRREALAIRYFDFGPEPAHNLPNIPAVLQVPNIAAPEWLESTTIPYRLAYREPQAVFTYVTGRWVAPPNSLLTGRLKNVLGGGAGVASPADAIRSGCIVRVALEDFSQTYDSAQSSHITVRARASLVANDGKVLIAQQVFGGDRPAATADMGGAVTALGASADAVAGAIGAWLAHVLDAGTPQGQTAIKQCRSS